MKFSILMPTFNRPEFIVKSIQSILSQDYEDFELLIQDGGKSIENLLPEDRRIKYSCSSDNGISDAMNKMLRRATGDIFNWSNDDDIMTSGTLRFVADNIRDSQWLYGKINLLDIDRNKIERVSGKLCDYNEILLDYYVPQPAMFWTRRAFEVVGFMDESMKFAIDYDYAIRLMARFKPFFADRIIATYSLHSQNTSKICGAEMISETKKIHRKYRTLHWYIVRIFTDFRFVTSSIIRKTYETSALLKKKSKYYSFLINKCKNLIKRAKTF